MRLSKQTKDKIRALPIISVADKLGMHLYGMGKLNRRCVCPFHDDHAPSLHLNATKNIFKCFSCGKGGDVIGLVMQVENLKYLDACQWLINKFNITVIEETNTKLLSSNTNLTNQTNKKFSNWLSPSGRRAEPSQILDKNKSVQSVSSVVDKKEISVNSVVSVCPLPSDLIPLEVLKKSRSIGSLFCQSLLSCSYLDYEQLRHAAQQYQLGVSRDGGVVFWQIDELQRIRTGKIMYYNTDCHRIKSRNPTWVHTLLKRQLPTDYTLHRCLFGQHLLNGKAPGATVCVVESEKTAVICSERIPDCLWLACGGLQMFSPEMLAPLVDYKVVIFPDTDLTGDTYRRWADIALQASKLYKFRYPLRVSRLLEDHASQDQKQRKIDLADFLFAHG